MKNGCCRPQTYLNTGLPGLRKAIAPVLACLLCPLLHGQDLTGQLAPGFSLPVWNDAGTTVDLHDYAGSIIVLDFFAYWCGPCQSSSPDVEENIQEYYHDLGGNPDGIPIQVIAVNIEPQNAALTNSFIENAGLGLVLDDSASRSVYNHYSTGGIPLFVIINGVADSPSHDQWEILHHQAGYSGHLFFRSLIDAVEARPMDASDPPVFLREPPTHVVGEIGGGLRIFSRGRAPGFFMYTWKRLRDESVVGTGHELLIERVSPEDAGEYVVLLTNNNGQVISQPCEVYMTLPPSADESRFGAAGLPATIPDRTSNSDPVVFHDFPLEVTAFDNPDEVGRLRINMDISHTYSGDLVIDLTAPSGTTIRLRDREGGSADNILVEDLPVEGFAGEPASGTWKLSIGDTYAEDEGTLNAWSLVFLPGVTTFGEWAAAEGYSPEVDPQHRPDGQGPTLLEQYAMGEPGNGLSMELSESGMEFGFTQANSRTDVQYLIESSPDCANWTLRDYSLTGSTDDTNTCSTGTMVIDQSSFFRCRISLVPSN